MHLMQWVKWMHYIEPTNWGLYTWHDCDCECKVIVDLAATADDYIPKCPRLSYTALDWTLIQYHSNLHCPTLSYANPYTLHRTAPSLLSYSPQPPFITQSAREAVERGRRSFIDRGSLADTLGDDWHILYTFSLSLTIYDTNDQTQKKGISAALNVSNSFGARTAWKE